MENVFIGKNLRTASSQVEVIPCMFLSFAPQSFVVHLMKIVEIKVL